jgi:hypothetical protein
VTEEEEEEEGRNTELHEENCSETNQIKSR